jgi:hypothetical protein
MSVTGSGNLTTTGGCGVYVNSTKSNALTVSGNGVVNAGSGSVKVVGGVSGTTTPTALTGQTAFTDPLGTLAAYTYSSCDHTNYSTSVADALSPGVYCGGITISGGAVTMSAGVYVLNGGGLNLSGGTLTGSKVMFYNTGTGGNTPKPITISGSGSATLSAPTSGTYKGVLIYQDRNVTYTTANTFSGNSSSTLTGTIYFPTTGLTISGGSSTATATTSYIVNTMTISGTASIRTDTTGTSTAGVTSFASLIQ